MSRDRFYHGLARTVVCLVSAVLTLALSSCLFSCTRTMYVPVKEVETVYQNHTDTIFKTDSIIRETERIVMQLDSQAMAKYGITLSNAERAWLVREKELENKINKLLEKKADTVIVRDSIPMPYPVEKPISTVNKMWMNLGKFSAGTCFCAILIGLIYVVSIKKR